MKPEVDGFLKAIGTIVGVSILIFYVLTSDASEPLKYFILTIFGFIVIFTYIQMIIAKQIKTLELAIEEMK